MRISALGLAALGAAIAAGVRPPAPAAEGPSIHDVRPIQIGYDAGAPPAGGDAIVLWKLEGEFEEIRVLDGEGPPLRILDGDAASASLGRLSLGRHEIVVEGWIGKERISSEEGPLEILAAPPADGVEPDGCLFYTYEPSAGGFLEYFWKNRDAAIPYVDFDISLDGVFRGSLAAPADRIRFTKASLGLHRLEVVPYTFNHICPPATISCRGEEVEPVRNPSCSLERCEDGWGIFRIEYELPGGLPLDGVAAFDVSGGGAGVLLGTFPPGVPIPLKRQETGSFEVELAAYRGDSASTIPSAPGDHVRASCTGLSGDACAVPAFRRGDCNGDRVVDLSDDIYLLAHLFLGGESPGCRRACDANGDGDLDLSDAIAGLAFLFLGGPPPPPPFEKCGADPLPGSLECRTFPVCAEV